MKLGKFFTTTLCFLLAYSSVQAQDIHFSQFYASPLNLNPAITGVMSCDMRVSAIYRNQWASVLGSNAFNTFSAGVEGKFQVGRSSDYYGLGLVLWADKAGSSNFSTVQASFSASYLKKIGGRRSNEHYLVAGGQIGVMQRSINTLNLMFGSQWNGDSFDGTLPTFEDITDTRLTVADVNAGLLWFSALDKKNKSNFYAGIAFSHLTKANVSFLNQSVDALFTKFTIHAGGEFRLGNEKRMALVPSAAFYVQGPSRQINIGTGYKFDFSKRSKSSQAFQIGVWARLVGAPTGILASDAIIAATRLRFGSSHIGFSYDINISRLIAATRGNGSFEVSYVYTMCGVRKKKLGCPTF